MKNLKSKEPKLASLILTASSGIALGVLLAVYILLTQPVEVVAKQPAEEVLAKPGDYSAFYTPGRVAGSETQNLRTALSRIERRTPGPVSFSEDEINYFFGQFKPAEPEAEAEGEEAPAGGKSRIEQFNVRIDGDQMLASVKMVIDPTGNRFDLLALANIGFENTEAGPRLVVNSVRVNGLPVPALGGIFASMIKSTVSRVPWPEEYLEMWQNIRNIELESDKLIVEVGLRRA